MRSRVRKWLIPALIAATLAVLIILLLVINALLSGDVYGHGELVIDLPSEFEERSTDEVYDVCYTDGTVTVGIMRLSFDACVGDGIPTTLSPRQFAEYYRSYALGGIHTTSTQTKGDVVWYTYTQGSSSGMSYTYMPTFYFSPYAYFIVTYILPTGDYIYKQDELLGYAESVRIEPARVED